MLHYAIKNFMELGETNTYEAEQDGQRFQVTEGYTPARTLRHATADKLYSAAMDEDGATSRNGVVNFRVGDTTFALKHGTTKSTWDTMSLTWQTITPLA